MSGSERVNLSGLRRGMEEADLDALIGVGPENFMYVSGAWLLSHKLRIQEVFSGVVIGRDSDPTAIVNGVYNRIMHRDSWIQDIRIMQERRNYRGDQETPLSVVADVLREHNATSGRVGVDMALLPAKSVHELETLLPDATLVPADDVFERARAIKTADEIAALQRAAVATEKAIRDAFANARVGDTEKKVANDIIFGILGAGAVDTWMVFHAGTNSRVIHHQPGDKKLMPGELVHVDCGGQIDGYFSDIARMAVVGEPSDLHSSRYRWLYQTMRNTIDHVRSGAVPAELYTAAKTTYEKEGFEYISQMVGHSIGVAIHEAPVLEPDEPTPLESGMVVQIEHGVDDHVGGRFHIEETVLVTDGAPKILSDYAPTNEIFVIE